MSATRFPKGTPMFNLRHAAPAFGLVLLAAGLTARPAAAQTYDAAGDFSATTNPNGVWSYGYEDTLGGAFNLYTAQFAPTATTKGWNDDISASVPLVIKNFGTAPDASFADLVLQPGQLAFHPGPQDQFSVVRFTAAQAGLYSLTSGFVPVTTDGTTTDVHVLENGLSLFDGNVSGAYTAPNGASYSNAGLSLRAGDTVDFAVGYGADGNYGSDSTGISATLIAAPVPEASTTVSLGLMLALGLGAVAVARRRKTAA